MGDFRPRGANLYIMEIDAEIGAQQPNYPRIIDLANRALEIEEFEPNRAYVLLMRGMSCGQIQQLADALRDTRQAWQMLIAMPVAIRSVALLIEAGFAFATLQLMHNDYEEAKKTMALTRIVAMASPQETAGLRDTLAQLNIRDWALDVFMQFGLSREK